ncbi:GAF domain-containing protein [Nonomuraea pusilla]|uniref:Histidine kinase-, DNA gyrase B-, and HSP90-like ATPase n=1 Tax=Nonomuraea pusilla TaxID=46177 RepID=A0A1H7TPZ4_9ACTN|nr:GAF domain-containing protein [Nonomuraea pusilla]SEL86942.1 Histidine kinase-, DNA gyrase B-, and HSP90-like ATPase [Nonomuraea pusilla]
MADDDNRLLLPGMRLDELLAELQTRLEAVLATRDRVHALLEAVVSIGADLDLETVLRRIVEAAMTLVDARYGALGVIGDEGVLVRFVPVGVTEEEIEGIAHWPHGKGLLGLLMKDPRPLRLADLSGHPESYGFPDGHPPMKAFLGVPIRVRDAVFGNLYLTEKSGGRPFEEEDEEIVTALATAAGVAIENARLYEEARRRETWLAASSDVTTSLLSGTDPHEVLEELAGRVCEMAGADTVTVSFLHGGDLHVEIAQGLGGKELLGRVEPVEGTLAGRAVRTGAPQNVLDLRSRPEDARVVAGLPLGPALVVPLGAQGRVQAVLRLARRGTRLPFGEPDLRMVEALVGQAAVALELAEARRDAERLGLLEDRDRIAKDLHDVVIQRLFATAMGLMSTVRLVDDPTVARRLGHAVDELDETIRQIRSTIFALQLPGSGGEPGLRGQVAELAESAKAHLGFAPGLRMEGPLDHAVPPELAEQALAVLREALSNAVRHARASVVDVLVGVADGELVVEVRDDGVGVPASGRRSGLRNLQERAERLGGRFSVAPLRAAGDGPAGGQERGQEGGQEGGRGERPGTRLRWQVPLPPA